MAKKTEQNYVATRSGDLSSGKSFAVGARFKASEISAEDLSALIEMDAVKKVRGEAKNAS